MAATRLHRTSTVALACLILVGASEQPQGQMRGSGSTRSPRPSDERRFKSGMTFVPSSLAGRRGRPPVRALRFGLITFDRSWLWTSGAADDIAAPVLSPVDQAPIGGLQVDVEPRRALVYVDGWYVGLVDEFSGYYRHLDIDAGWHTLEILAPDYEPLIVDVTVAPHRTTTFRGSLNRAPDRH
jgi:hypothetical protein